MRIKYILNLSLILLAVGSCHSQSKMDKNKLEIKFPVKVNMNMVKTGQNVIIINKSDKTYIIDPLSFTTNAKVIENNKEMQPYRQKLYGSYNRDTEDCKETISIIKPKEKTTIKVFFFLLIIIIFLQIKDMY